MKIGAKQAMVLAALVGIGAGMQALASGGTYAHNKPGGEPGDQTCLTPYAKEEGGRLALFCAQDEKLVVTPVDGGAVEVTCMPADR